ncbi:MULTISPECIES: response regulator [unclassified Nostoc]|uniref:hybrid sensor histidine kinase/response regulator n=1 Tax=unclassified Nostoc TaxID=2593658 RepID=UPI002AD5A9D8|nr:response regulator [Nostoc sp. DedQUE03]MDZ7971527.1 response regulator [Nostoc sp. DedQUE03]MDZ8049283.1 response regulator [Nostoc sp. DedQUE02]
MTKILVIEDEPSLREEILDILESEGFDVMGAEDGLEGLDSAQTNFPDLILCDVMLPRADGYAVLSGLRQNPDTALIPFIFLTAKATRENVRQGMDLGADDYLTKPFRMDELLNAITSRLTKQATIVQIHQKVTQLQHSNLLKDEFIGTASQELRGPATNIMMALKLLQQAANPEQTQRYIDRLQQECYREIHLIDDLLDLHYLGANERPLQPEKLNLQTWIPAIVEPFKTQARKRQQTLWSNIPPYLPMPVIDAADFKRILSELLNNACKYTAPGGKIVLEARCDLTASEAINPDGQMIMLIVSNEAEIPDKFIPNLFQPFYRVPESDRWQQGGNGLGLTLIEKLAKRLNGKVQISSKAGWTQFTLQLPIETNLPTTLAPNK